MAIAIIAGTTAELIKLGPIMRAITDAGDTYRLWNTAQHVQGTTETLADLRLPPPDRHLVPLRAQRQIVSSLQVPGWTARVLAHAVRHMGTLKAELRRGPGRPLVIVHGDTFTTVLGALIGRMCRVDVAHVEAGMRSGSIMHPMPEELNRRAVAKLARIHFAPTDNEVTNLRRERARGAIVDTGANTVVDSVRLIMSDRAPAVDLPSVFGLVTLHRHEMLRNADVYTETLEVLREASRTTPLVMPAGATERRRIEELGLGRLFDDRFRMLDKAPYADFLPILARASFVVTDSGGLQQECGILGVPCAIQRETTESLQGVGENLLVTGLDMELLRGFLSEWESYRRESKLDAFHPTDVIVRNLRANGYLPDHR